MEDQLLHNQAKIDKHIKYDLATYVNVLYTWECGLGSAVYISLVTLKVDFSLSAKKLICKPVTKYTVFICIKQDSYKQLGPNKHRIQLFNVKNGYM